MWHRRFLPSIHIFHCSKTVNNAPLRSRQMRRGTYGPQVRYTMYGQCSETMRTMVILPRITSSYIGDHSISLTSPQKINQLTRRDKISDNSGHIKAKSMTWSWTDYAYKQELRIIGREKDVPFPKKQFDPKKISHETLKRMVKPGITFGLWHDW